MIRIKTMATIAVISACAVACALTGSKQANEPQWESLFNGKDLTGWTPKITGYPCGENFGNTFRVEDGLIKVRYDAYDKFGDRFGHLYTNKDYSYYKIRIEYRFVGEQVNEGPGWATRNSGAMLHCPDPATMAIDQNFPVSIEAQFLGGDGVNERGTGNVCTPGTELSINGERYTGHCANAKVKTYHGEQWVTAELVVLGDEVAYHIFDGDTVMTYTKMVYGGGGVSPAQNFEPNTPISKGRIALQSESHPVDFRKVEIMDLSELYKK